MNPPRTVATQEKEEHKILLDVRVKTWQLIVTFHPWFLKVIRCYKIVYKFPFVLCVINQEDMTPLSENASIESETPRYFQVDNLYRIDAAKSLS